MQVANDAPVITTNMVAITCLDGVPRLVGGTVADHPPNKPLTEPFGLVDCSGPIWEHTESGSWWPWRWAKTYRCYTIDNAPGFRVIVSDDGIERIGDGYLCATSAQ